ncbi:MAG: hypothetical protein U9R54_01870 [Bacteroidota bacterium]|nr:hypothetical protein [Bacteroidota bacterium]
MKKLIIIAINIVFITNISFSQEISKKNKLKAEKIAFFTNKIGLSPSEAQNFWPVYNEYWELKNNIIKKRKKEMIYFSNNCSQLSEKEIEKYADNYISYELKIAKLLNEYHLKFKKILPIKKVMKIYQADYEFKTYLLKQIKNK